LLHTINWPSRIALGWLAASSHDTPNDPSRRDEDKEE
jgi:hypothetical protein